MQKTVTLSQRDVQTIRRLVDALVAFVTMLEGTDSGGTKLIKPKPSRRRLAAAPKPAEAAPEAPAAAN